jgi:uncharacterized protein YjbI with pentapeptide repeats
VNVDLTNVSLKGANLKGVDLTREDLSGANIEEAKFTDSDTQKTQITVEQILKAKNWDKAHYSPEFWEKLQAYLTQENS